MELKKTLGEVRADIQIRLGFGAAGQAGIVNTALIDSMIKSAQEQLYQQFDWVELRAINERVTGSNQQFYDYPIDCNSERILGMWVLWGGQYMPMQEGIKAEQRNIPIGGVPQRYERRDQIEIWPIPSSNEYKIRTEYIKTLAPLVNNSDRLTLNSQMVFLHALANAKTHYNQKDAVTYSSQLDALMLQLKAKNRKTVFANENNIDPFTYVDATQGIY